MIELREVTKEYKGGCTAVNQISLTIKSGEFVSVIGPSGAGKTTLMRLLNGMLSPTDGEVYIDENKLTNVSRKKKRKIQQTIGTIYQNFCLVSNSTVLNNVLNADLAHMSFLRVLLGIFTKEQKARARKALEEVSLSDKESVKANQLSGGQQQRVAIARALMQNSKILLADEPVSALDPVTSRQILDLLKRLQKEHGLTIVMNSHNVAFAKEYSDHIIGIADGHIVVEEEASKLTDNQLKAIYGESFIDRENAYE